MVSSPNVSPASSSSKDHVPAENSAVKADQLRVSKVSPTTTALSAPFHSVSYAMLDTSLLPLEHRPAKYLPQFPSLIDSQGAKAIYAPKHHTTAISTQSSDIENIHDIAKEALRLTKETLQRENEVSSTGM